MAQQEKGSLSNDETVTEIINAVLFAVGDVITSAAWKRVIRKAVHGDPRLRRQIVELVAKASSGAVASPPSA